MIGDRLKRTASVTFLPFFIAQSGRKDAMAYVYYNPNPSGNRVGDCVVRGIARVIGQDWDSTFIDLAIMAFAIKDMPSANHVWGTYLKERGFSRHVIPDTCPDCYTVRDFCSDNPTGLFLLGTGSHVIAVENGNYFDSWDSGDEVPAFYWIKENYDASL